MNYLQPEANDLGEGPLCLHAVGACPQLQSLHHNAWGATAAHLGQHPMLESLTSRIWRHQQTHFSLVEGLAPLTRLQHLDLAPCVPLHFCTS